MYIEEAILNLITNNQTIKNSGVEVEPNETGYQGKSSFIVYSFSEKPIKQAGTARAGELVLYIFAELKTGAKELEEVLQGILNGYAGEQSDLQIKNISYQGSEDGYDRQINKFFYVANYSVIYSKNMRGYA